MENNTVNVDIEKRNRRKDIWKVIRSIIQVILIAFIVLLIISTFVSRKRYVPYESEFAAATEDNGFIAVSYFAVDEFSSESMISAKQLDDHIRSLKESGYVTITQQDVMDYYAGKKLLPEKSLFLFFEDGRRDSAIFAQRSMEKYNYVASMISYAENLNKTGLRMLSGSDLKELQSSSFWEVGTNGYRLSYINVFDRHGDFLGEMTPEEYITMTPFLQKDYNHYLMDYIRDEDLIPLESKKQMQERVEWDYEELQEVFEREIGYVPELYVLMHSNTNQYGTDDHLSEENEKWMKEIFKMNFNRDGESLNILSENDNIYDMTRLSPGANWANNHLLMRLYEDTEMDMKWQIGDEAQAKSWELSDGAIEFKQDELILTSPPREEGMATLDSLDVKDINFTADFVGNKLGSQSVYLRESEDRNSYIKIEIINNYLYIYESIDGSEEQMLELSLDELDGVEYQTYGENHAEALEKGIDVKKTQRYNASESKAIARDLAEEAEEDLTDEEVFVPEIRISDFGNRKVSIKLLEDKLEVMIDEKLAADVSVSVMTAGSVSIAAYYGGESFDERDVNDDVYDTRLKNLKITDVESGKVLFSNVLEGWSAMTHNISEFFRRAAYWFAHAI